MREMDRLRESSTWAFFECDRARCGIAGASIELLLDGRTPAVVADRWGMSKKLMVLLGSLDMGDDSIDDAGVVVAVSMKLREMVVKSESLLDMMEELDDEEEEMALRSLIFGAFKALTFVVEMSSVGSDMRSLLIVPLTLPSRVGTCFSLLKPRFVRFVSARARDAIVVVA